MTLKTKRRANTSSKEFVRVATKPPRSLFPDPEDNPAFWAEYGRYPRHELAEAVILLRQLRGISQAELAKRMGTKQPAIARIEAAQSNVGLDTVRALAQALGAVVQIRLLPEEDAAPA